MRRILHSLDDTRQLAIWLAARLKPGDVLALYGDLGSGKTALVKALAAAWGGDEAMVRSPTFALIHAHELPALRLIHADLYRMAAADELQGCGLLDDVGAEGVVVAIEWPEIAEPWLPADSVRIHLQLTADDVRVATVTLPPGR